MAYQSTKPVVLYTCVSPNAAAMSVYLEELRLAYGGPDYDAVKMSLSEDDIGKVHDHVKSPWFLDINPNGRAPAITHEGFHVFETSAILLYLGQTFDNDNKFTWDPALNPKEYSEQLQWLFFTHGGIGPMLGQAHHFISLAPENILYAVNRYVKESNRLFSVLEGRLKDRDYLVGAGRGKFGLADIKTFPWIRIGNLHIDGIGYFPALKAWIDRIEARPAVQAGLLIPAQQ